MVLNVSEYGPVALMLPCVVVGPWQPLSDASAVGPQDSSLSALDLAPKALCSVKCFSELNART